MLNLGILLLFDNFLKSGQITFLYFWCTTSWRWYLSTVKRWIWLKYSKGHLQSRKGQVWPIFHNNRYFSVVTKCCQIVLHHVASVEWNQSSPKIWKIWNYSKRQKGPIWSIWANTSETVHAMTNVSMKHLYKVICNISVYITTFDLRLILKVR